MRGCRRRSRAQSYWYLVPYAAHRWVQRMIQPQLRIQRTVALYQSVVRYHTLPPQQISRQQKLTRPCRINHINRQVGDDRRTACAVRAVLHRLRWLHVLRLHPARRPIQALAQPTAVIQRPDALHVRSLPRRVAIVAPVSARASQRVLAMRVFVKLFDNIITAHSCRVCVQRNHVHMTVPILTYALDTTASAQHAAYVNGFDNTRPAHQQMHMATAIVMCLFTPHIINRARTSQSPYVCGQLLLHLLPRLQPAVIGLIVAACQRNKCAALGLRVNDVVNQSRSLLGSAVCLYFVAAHRATAQRVCAILAHGNDPVRPLQRVAHVAHRIYPAVRQRAQHVTVRSCGLRSRSLRWLRLSRTGFACPHGELDSVCGLGYSNQHSDHLAVRANGCGGVTDPAPIFMPARPASSQPAARPQSNGHCSVPYITGASLHVGRDTCVQSSCGQWSRS